MTVTVGQCAHLSRVDILELLARMRAAGMVLNVNSSLSLAQMERFCAYEKSKKMRYKVTTDAIDLGYIRALVREGQYENCKICGQSIKRSSLQKHVQKAHSKDRLRELPIGLQVAADLGKERWIARHVKSCESCRRPITVLDIGDAKVKTYDVDTHRYITGTHACNPEAPTSRSIRALSAGAVESNRRRH